MKFQKGNKAAKGGRRNPPGGRPTNEVQAAKKVAAERAREKIEAEVDGVMDEYIRLAKGGKIKRGSSPQTIRHCVERWLPRRTPEDSKGNTVPPMIYIHPDLEEPE